MDRNISILEEIAILEQRRDDLIFELETIENESKAEFEKCNHEIEDISLAIQIAITNEEIEKLDAAIEELTAIFERMKHALESDNYHNPLFLELLNDDELNIYLNAK